MRDMMVSVYLVLGCVLVEIVVMQMIRRQVGKLERKGQKYIDLPSNYSMMIRRLPQDYSEWDIQEMVNERRKGLTEYEKEITSNLRIEKIVLSYSLREVIEIEERNIDNFKKSVKKKEKFTPEDIPKPTKIAPLAIVTFDAECAKDYFISEPTTWQKILIFFWSIYLPYSKYTVKGQKVSIQKAPEPDDIYWQNCGISYYGNLCRRLVGKFLIFLLLIVGLFVQVILKYYELEIASMQYAQFMNVAFSLAVTLFNALLGELLEFVTKKERLETVTEQSISLTATLSVLQFLNSGIIVMFSSLIININTYSLDNLANNVVTIMLINMVLPHVIVLIWDGYNPVKRFQRWRVETTSNAFTQKEVNQAYEGGEVKIAIRCAYVIKTIWLTMFYGIFFPIVIPISILGILGFYHVEKYMYLKKYKVPNMISSALNKEVLDLLDYSPFFLAVSTFFLYLYLNYFQLNNINQKFSIGFIGIYIGLGLSIIHILIPTDKINSKIFKFENQDMYKPSCKEVQRNFNTDYDIANPVYHQINKKKKNNKFFKGIGQLGGLFNFLTVKKEVLETGESRLIFGNTGDKVRDIEKQKDYNSKYKSINNDCFAMMLEMTDTRRPLTENQCNIFESYVSVTNKQKEKERQKEKDKNRHQLKQQEKQKPCSKAEKRIRRQYMQPYKINAPHQDNMFIVNVSEVLASECFHPNPIPVKFDLPLPFPSSPNLTPPSSSPLLSPPKKPLHSYQENLLHPNFVSKVRIEDIVPVFLGYERRQGRGVNKLKRYGSMELEEMTEIGSPKKRGGHDETF